MLDQIIKYMQGKRFREAMGVPMDVKIDISLLAQGEYNMNYIFEHPVSKQKLLLRMNTGSQMHLEEQIEYEYLALKQLETSGRVPKALYVDGSKQELPYGVMVMEYLPGIVMDYEKDMKVGAEILADIHSMPIDSAGSLLHSKNPCKEILEECEQMFHVYETSPLADEKKRAQIRKLLWKQHIRNGGK